MYKKFPGANKVITPVTAADAPAPIRTAVRLMTVGAAVSTASLILSLAGVGGWKTAIRKADPKWTTAQVNQAFQLGVITTVVIGLLTIALWLVMARGAAGGRKWSRIVSSVLFGLYTVDALSTIARSGTVVSFVFLILTWIIGSVTIFLLWKPESKAFFNPV
jgi:hypothetical protein